MDPMQLAKAQQGLDKGKSAINDGLTGGLVGAFMGQGFKDQMNSALDQGQQAIDMAAKQTALFQTGKDAVCLVESVEDTGKTVNMNPVLKLGLKLDGKSTTFETMVPRIIMPRVGDSINIKYDPNDLTNVMVMGIVPPAAVQPAA